MHGLYTCYLDCENINTHHSEIAPHSNFTIDMVVFSTEFPYFLLNDGLLDVLNRLVNQVVKEQVQYFGGKYKYKVLKIGT